MGTTWQPRVGSAIGERHESSLAGRLLFYPGGASETELLLAYGSVRFASKVGQLAGNHFLTITSGLEPLGELGQLVLWKGSQTILIELT